MIAVWLVAVSARAQGAAEALLHATDRDDAVRFTAEMDPAIALGLGYVRALDLPGRRMGLHVDTTSILGFSSWDLVGGVSMPIVDGAGLDALATTDLELKYVHNDVHSGLVYGYGASVRPGWFGSWGYAAADLALHGTFAATLRHSDAYRAQFPEVVDRTYTTANLSGFVGATGGVCVGERVLIGARVAWRIPRTLESYAPWFQPYTVDLDVGVRF